MCGIRDRISSHQPYANKLDLWYTVSRNWREMAVWRMHILQKIKVGGNTRCLQQSHLWSHVFLCLSLGGGALSLHPAVVAVGLLFVMCSFWIAYLCGETANGSNMFPLYLYWVKAFPHSECVCSFETLVTNFPIPWTPKLFSKSTPWCTLILLHAAWAIFWIEVLKPKDFIIGLGCCDWLIF